MAAGLDRVLELPLAGLHHPHVLDRRLALRSVGRQVAREPAANDLSRSGGVLWGGQQVVGVVEADETLGVSGGQEDPGGVVDPHDLVDGRMQNQQRLAHGVNRRLQPMPLDIFDELPGHGEAAAAELDHGGPVGQGILRRGADGLEHMRRVGGSADDDDGSGFRDVLGQGQDRRPAQRMADQHGRRLIMRPQIVDRGRQVGDVRGEAGVGELALAAAQACEVEPQHRHPDPREVGGDAAGGQYVLRTGEAVGEEGVAAHRPVGQLQPGREARAGMAGEAHGLDHGGHRRPPLRPLTDQAASGRRRRTRASRRSLRQKRVFSGSG